MIVQIDVDGVVADFMTAFTRLARDMGFTQNVSGTTEQKVWERYGDVPPEAVGRVWDRIKQSKDFWLHCDPLVDTNTFLRLADMTEQHDLYFVTARVGKHAKRQTEVWLSWHGMSRPCVVISSRKGEIAKALDANYAIDDKAGNPIFTAYYSPKTRSYVIDRPYNKFDSDVVGGKVRRVATLDAFLDDVEAGK